MFVHMPLLRPDNRDPNLLVLFTETHKKIEIISYSIYSEHSGTDLQSFLLWEIACLDSGKTTLYRSISIVIWPKIQYE